MDGKIEARLIEDRLAFARIGTELAAGRKSEYFARVKMRERLARSRAQIMSQPKLRPTKLPFFARLDSLSDNSSAVPQRLKPRLILRHFGTAEAVP